MRFPRSSFHGLLQQNQTLKSPFLNWPRVLFLLCCMVSSAVIFLSGTSFMLSGQRSTESLLNQALIDQQTEFISLNQPSLLRLNSLPNSAFDQDAAANPAEIRQITDRLPKTASGDTGDNLGLIAQEKDRLSNADNLSADLRLRQNASNGGGGQDSACDGRRIFAYDIPAEFNIGVAKECKDMVQWLNFCRHLAHGGFGQKATAASGDGGGSPAGKNAIISGVFVGKRQDEEWEDWYETDPYMLEVIFRTKMEKYRCRTTDPAAADAFFIPFYSGLDALRYLYGKKKSQGGEQGVSLLRWLSENYGEYWRRKGGRDHFIVMGRTAWDFSRPLEVTEGWGTSLAELPEMENVTGLFLERRPWRQNEQAIPYPTAFHPRSAGVLKAWQERVLAAKRRRFLFAFVGAPRPSSSPGDLGSFRQVALQQCVNSSHCTLLDCSQIKCAHNPIAIARRLLQSDFCLQPPGDTATRRSTFDGILSGCIPVFFREDSAYTQYGWHLPPSPAFQAGAKEEDYSVLIGEGDKWRVEKVLASISRKKVEKMRRFLVANLIPAIIYAAPSAYVTDAFEVSLDGILRRAAGF